MITEGEVEESVILPAFRNKCEHEGLEIDLHNGLPREKRDEILSGWQNTLPDLVSTLPEFSTVYNTLEYFVRN
jgi:predicted nucleotidyltransferase component of viral defense system